VRSAGRSPSLHADAPVNCGGVARMPLPGPDLAALAARSRGWAIMREAAMHACRRLHAPWATAVIPDESTAP
jgi:hypothetical protein